TPDAATHAIQKLDQVVNFGLGRGVVNDGAPTGEHRRHQHVLGARDAGLSQAQLGSAQAAACSRVVVAPLVFDLGAERAQSFDVHIHGPSTDAIAAWVGNDDL